MVWICIETGPYAPQGHDSGGEGDAPDGVEIGEVGEDQVDASEADDEVGGPGFLGVGPDGVVGLLQGLAAGDHVHNVGSDLHHQLLRHHDPQPQLLPECVLPQLMVPVEPLPRHHLVHLHHLPQRVQRYYP